MPNKKVLIVAYYWPPASSPGVQRWLKFTKFLENCGWKSIVITPKSGSYPNTDPTLLNDVAKSTEVIKTSTIEPFRMFNILSGNANRGKVTSVGMGDIKGSQSLFKKASGYIRANWFIPDARKGWVPYAVKEGQKIINSQNIDAIVTTGPPHSSHIIGLELSKRNNIPWLADFRDPWTNIYYNNFLPRTQRTKEKDYKLESKILSEATSVSTVSNGLVQEFEDRAKSILLLPNGYDEEDFHSVNPTNESEVFEISYIGNFKENQNCENFWRAISELSDELEGFREKIRVSLIGNVHITIKQTIDRFELNQVVTLESFVEHQIAVERMANSSVLLFIIPNSEKNHQIITGKIFEYLASRTPLLSIGPIDGDASEILNSCQRNKMIDYADSHSMKVRIQSHFEEWQLNGCTKSIKNDLHTKFSREQLTVQLSNELERICNAN